MKSLDKKLVLILVVWLGFTGVIALPAPGASMQLVPTLEVINEDDLFLGPLTKGDVLQIYQIFSSTIGVVLFFWAWYVYRQRYRRTK